MLVKEDGFLVSRDDYTLELVSIHSRDGCKKSKIFQDMPLFRVVENYADARRKPSKTLRKLPRAVLWIANRTWAGQRLQAVLATRAGDGACEIGRKMTKHLRATAACPCTRTRRNSQCSRTRHSPLTEEQHINNDCPWPELNCKRHRKAQYHCSALRQLTLRVMCSSWCRQTPPPQLWL